MGIFDKFKKVYLTKCRCYNCGNISELSVPKGRTIDEFIASEQALCPTCQCATLKRIIVVAGKTGQVFTSQPQKKVRPLKPKVEAKASDEPEFEYQEVKHYLKQGEQVTEAPIKQPNEEAEFKSFSGPGPKKVNFWTGKESKE